MIRDEGELWKNHDCRLIRRAGLDKRPANSYNLGSGGSLEVVRGCEH